MIAPDGAAWEAAGPDGAPAVVLIHGLGLHRGMFAPHVARLSRRWRVVSYDLYGHGESAPPPEAPSLSLFARQLEAVMDDAGIGAAHLIGFSLGGMINRRLAMDRPERVRSLAIVSSPHERGEEEQRKVEQRARDSAGGPAATLDAAIERWFTPEFRAARPDYIDMIRRWVLANDAESYAACRWVLAHGVRELIRPDPPLSLPALAITGEHDEGSAPAMSRAIAAEIPGAECVIVPGCRHMGIAEAPDAFLDPIMAFLEKQE